MLYNCTIIFWLKETICESLDAYNSQIEQLKSEMRATVESTNEIRSQLHNLKLQ